ncbi:MAG: T9SS type A sorting domain-containing protein [Candidatus Delongbacteria bacterium]|nr:T9SS type A sorting domain-containing protein [Candidatus Delongbacteria bacterium]
MKKHILLIIFIGIFLPIYAQVATPPALGVGSELDPYQIANLENLYWLTADTLNFDKHYIQTADINAYETITWFDSTGWLPIGIYEIPSTSQEAIDCRFSFSGYYDGQNFTIDSLHINQSEWSGMYYLGLFGRTLNATLKNINLTDESINIFGYGNTFGGLAGEIKFTSVSNCYTQANIVAPNCGSIGGLIGRSENSDIENSHSDGYIETAEIMMPNIGGLVAVNSTGGSIHKCSSSVNINGIYGGGDSVGGLVAVNDSRITQCYSDGDINGYSWLGGLVWANGVEGVISDCFSSSNISGAGIGGLVASNQGSITRSFSNGSLEGEVLGGLISVTVVDSIFEDCFWDIETSGVDSSAGGVGLTTIEMQTLSTFTDAGWDFVGESTNGTENIWDINGVTNGGYPFFSWMSTSIDNAEFTVENYKLEQNYPNPFNPSTTINFSLPSMQDVKLSVFNSSGQLVKELVNEKLSSGRHKILFNADNLNSGIYFYALNTEGKRLSNKMLLIK